eukprot:SAG31_NODE_30732_length_376_cov_12.000000_1_plen_96_part_01
MGLLFFFKKILPQNLFFWTFSGCTAKLNLAVHVPVRYCTSTVPVRYGTTTVRYHYGTVYQYGTVPVRWYGFLGVPSLVSSCLWYIFNTISENASTT